MTEPPLGVGLGIKKPTFFGTKLFLARISSRCPAGWRSHDRAITMMMEIQAPLPVAQLPRPLNAEGKSLFNSVFGASTSGKVKRYEIVAAIDGEAVNLYDVSVGLVVPPRFVRAKRISRCNLHS